jgi:hypothetical protein
MEFDIWQSYAMFGTFETGFWVRTPTAQTEVSSLLLGHYRIIMEDNASAFASSYVNVILLFSENTLSIRYKYQPVNAQFGPAPDDR